jgi:hypothetical protein
MMWAAVSADYVCGPHFSGGSFYHKAYHGKLQTWFVLRLRLRGFQSTYILHQDGALERVVVLVPEYLNNIFSG